MMLLYLEATKNMLFFHLLHARCMRCVLWDLERHPVR